MSSNKSAKQKLIDKYGAECFIEKLKIRKLPPETKFSISRKEWKRMNTLTYHHILEKSKGGKATEENGALLKAYNHQWFHQQPPEEQAKMNQMFQDYKKNYREVQVEYGDFESDIEVKSVAFTIEDLTKKKEKYNRAKEKQELQKEVKDYYEKGEG